MYYSKTAFNKFIKEGGWKAQSSFQDISHVVFLEQSKLGDADDGDCVLVSIVAKIIATYHPDILPEEIYAVVLKHAKRHFYSKKKGTFQPFIADIYRATLKELKIKAARPQTKVFQDKKQVMEILNTNRKVILSVRGHSYYGDHTVLAFGYTYLYNSNGEKKLFIHVADNWHKTASYIDYDEVKGLNFAQLVF